MTEIWNRVQELARLVEEQYNAISLINSSKRILEPVSNDFSANDYVQFGYKLIMPRWIFEGNADNRMVAYECADGLSRSEILYLIKKMGESQISKKTYSINNIDIHELTNHFLSLDGATDLFMPLNIAYNKQFYSFYSPNLNFQIDGRDRINIGHKILRLHMSSNRIPFDNIFVLNSSGVVWSQKKVKDMTASRAKDPEGLKLLTNENGILQISAKINDDGSVLFLIRLVADAVVDPEKVKMINISKKLLDEI